jgi:methionine sulfoxide reductase heme-binding subunit
MRPLSTIIKLRIGLLFRAESCANLRLLRCGVKGKTAQDGTWDGISAPSVFPAQMALIGACRKVKRVLVFQARDDVDRMGGSARSGRWPSVWLATLAAALAPGCWIAGLALAGGLGARPLKQAINLTGDWSIYLLLVALAITPARHILAAPRLLLARRTLGVAAFGYAALHLVLYALDLDLDLGRVASEIVLRTYLTIGAVALVGLAALAATSWDGAVRRLGPARWSRLHRLVYACALLSVVHFLLRSPTDTFAPMVLAGLLAWLAGFRLLQRRGAVGADRLVALAVAAAALTAFAETAWHAAATGIDPWRILAAHLQVGYGLRPAWWVLIAGSLAAGARAYRRSAAPPRADAPVTTA